MAAPMRVVFPMLFASLRREETRNMRLIKERIESGHRHHATTLPAVQGVSPWA